MAARTGKEPNNAPLADTAPSEQGNSDLWIHRSRIDKVLAERDRLFPKQDPSNTLASRESLRSYGQDLLKLRKRDWQPDEQLVDAAKPVTETPVFICGFMKSGTTLLTGLLDGHPELIVMPGDSRMLNLIQRQSRTSHVSQLNDWDLYWISRLVNPTGQRPFWILGESDQPYVEFLEYLNYWLKGLPSESRSPFLAVVLSYFCANRRRPSNPKMWVEKMPGNEHRIRSISALFPQSKFLHIVRDPRANLASLKKLKTVRGQTWNCAESGYALHRSFKCGETNQRRLGKERYCVLLYEDLIQDSPSAMGRIADFLGIAHSDSLLQPSVNGDPAVSNSMYRDRRVEGQVLKEPGEKWRQTLTPEEVLTISGILHSTAGRWGYELADHPNLAYRMATLGRLLLTKVHRKIFGGRSGV